MAKVTKEAIMASYRHINAFRKLYNELPRKYQVKLVKLCTDVNEVGMQVVVDRVDAFIEQLPDEYKNRAKELLKNG